MPSRMADARLKLERADKHIQDVEAGVLAFVFGKPEPYAVVLEVDPQTGESVYRVGRIDDVPPIISCAIGDAVHNLFSALDHMAMAVNVRLGGDRNDRQIKFPVRLAADADKPNSGRKKHLPLEQVEAFIERADVHDRGAVNDFVLLNELDNIDKHRRLNAVGALVAGVMLDPRGAGLLLAARGVTDLRDHVPGGVSVRSRSAPLPLKAGEELLRCPPDAIPQGDDQFRLQVAVYEPPVVQGEFAIPLLGRLAATVRRVASALEPLL